MNVILPLIEGGSVSRYTATPRYVGASFVPSAIEVRASDPGDSQTSLHVWARGS
jgi:hypothetical protein